MQFFFYLKRNFYSHRDNFSDIIYKNYKGQRVVETHKNYSGATHIGKIRSENQDYWKAHSTLKAFFLADGMGGRKGGKIAAQMAISKMASCLSTAVTRLPMDHIQAIDWVKKAVEDTNQAVFEISQSQFEIQGMGTTLACLWILPGYFLCCHVGDSRIYRVRGYQLQQLTQDHTVVKEGSLNARSDINKHVLSRAIGITSYVEPSIQALAHQVGDLFLLCSDGLTNALSDDQIEQILLQPSSLDKKADCLIQGALQVGGKDNITVVLVQL